MDGVEQQPLEGDEAAIAAMMGFGGFGTSKVFYLCGFVSVLRFCSF
jgi:hypothetical protein